MHKIILKVINGLLLLQMRIPVEHFSATPVYALSPALEQNLTQEPVLKRLHQQKEAYLVYLTI
jgi:hypothetical protein